MGTYTEPSRTTCQQVRPVGVFKLVGGTNEVLVSSLSPVGKISLLL